MTKRILIALCAGLACMGPTFAQAPPEVPIAVSAPAEEATIVPMPAEESAVVQAPAEAPAVAQPAPEELTAPPVVAAPATPFGSPVVGDGMFSGAAQRFWVTGEYLFSWFKGDRLPTLVTTSPAGTARTVAGALGPSSSTVIGDTTVNGGLRSGFRFQVGYWFDPERLVGIEAGTMVIASQGTNFFAASDGTSILARPFTDVTTNTPQAALIAFPGSSAGNVSVSSRSGSLYEAHLDLSEKLIDTGSFLLTGMVGYRFYRYDEGLGIHQTILPTGGTFVPGTQVSASDNFSTQNTFNGCDFGLRSQFFWDKLSLGLLAKLAVGYVHREVDITGNSVTTVPGAAPVAQTGGLYALSSNLGRHGSNDFGILPELGANLSWEVSPGIQLRLGYSILWLDRVARAPQSIDFNVNSTLLPPATSPTGTNAPAFSLNRQNVWVQNLSIGLAFTF